MKIKLFKLLQFSTAGNIIANIVIKNIVVTKIWIINNYPNIKH